MQDEVLDKCRSFIVGQEVDFIDIRYEIVKETGITFESESIKDVGSAPEPEARPSSAAESLWARK